MTSEVDYYELLGCERTADDATIKTAYRKLAMKFHPDKNAGCKDAESKFKAVSEAYDCLKDPQKRAAYDRFGHAAFRNGGGHAGAQDFSGFSDIFESVFGEFMGGARGGGRQGQRRARYVALTQGSLLVVGCPARQHLLGQRLNIAHGRRPLCKLQGQFRSLGAAQQHRARACSQGERGSQGNPQHFGFGLRASETLGYSVQALTQGNPRHSGRASFRHTYAAV